MQRIRLSSRQLLGLFFASTLPVGCAHFDPVTNSTLAGSGLGATTGAIIGHQSGNTGTGALVGAAAGALGGALVGDAKQARAERDAAYAQAHSAEQAAFASALTNTDVIYMAQNGLGEDVIINAIHTRGGRFDTSPHSLINLKSGGVSDAVIRAMQAANSAPPRAVTYVEPPPPPIVFVEPPPPRPIIFGHIGPRYRHRYHCGPRRRPRTGIHIHGHF